MPKQYETNSLGYKLKFKGPSTVEEYDQAAGRVGACLEDAIDNTIYRSTLPEWQGSFAKKLTEITGTQRGVDAEATARAKSRAKEPDKIKDVPQKVKAFHGQVTSGMSDADKKALAATAQEVADAIVVDPSPSKRQAGPGKEELAKANDILNLPADQMQAKIDKYTAKVGDFDLETDDDGKPDAKSLARLIGMYLSAILAED